MDAEEVLNEIENRVLVQDKSKQLQEKFLINRDEEETKMTLDFARALLALEIEIKAIKDDMKEIKREAKANGVSVMKVNKVITQLKKDAKEKEEDISEIVAIENVLSNDVDIKTMIMTLVKKD